MQAALVFPAYAGVNPPEEPEEPEDNSIPRVCGGEPLATAGISASVMYSPRMRG